VSYAHPLSTPRNILPLSFTTPRYRTWENAFSTRHRFNFGWELRNRFFFCSPSRLCMADCVVVPHPPAIRLYKRRCDCRRCVQLAEGPGSCGWSVPPLGFRGRVREHFVPKRPSRQSGATLHPTVCSWQAQPSTRTFAEAPLYDRRMGDVGVGPESFLLDRGDAEVTK
jgi:hypothetical protein